jgi:hypothetical protein
VKLFCEVDIRGGSREGVCKQLYGA